MRADLHVHSTYSDGSWTREEILEEALHLGITQLAFTDHDTVQDAQKAVSLGKKYGIDVLPGIEISAYDFKEKKKVHILGYGYTSGEALTQLCTPVLLRRDANCVKQIEILASLGYHIQEKDVRGYTAGTIYKQHILKYLCDTGQSEALFGRIYREIFKNGGPCDFDITYVDAADAVRAIRECGGIPVLAHPGQQQNFSVLPRLVDAGLLGIEKNHPSNCEKDQKLAEELAEHYGLYCTGGSDFHGIYEADGVPLGTVLAPRELHVTAEDRKI